MRHPNGFLCRESCFLERQFEDHLEMVSSVTGKRSELRSRGALAPRFLFIGSKDPFAQIILNISMKGPVAVVADLSGQTCRSSCVISCLDCWMRPQAARVPVLEGQDRPFLPFNIPFSERAAIQLASRILTRYTAIRRNCRANSSLERVRLVRRTKVSIANG